MGYSKEVINHFENPQNVGSMDTNLLDVGTGLVGAPACGDVMKLQLKINDSGIIEDAKFKTFGCGSALASSSLVTTWVKGKGIEFAEKITNMQIAKELSLPPVKIHCSVLAEDAVKKAILDWKNKQVSIASSLFCSLFLYSFSKTGPTRFVQVPGGTVVSTTTSDPGTEY